MSSELEITRYNLAGCVEALRVERATSKQLRATVENLLGVLDDVIEPTGYTASLIQSDVLDAKRVLGVLGDVSAKGAAQ